jgi:hypothetical protein
MPTVLGWAGMVDATEEVMDFAELTVADMHERIERVLGNNTLVAALKKMGAGDRIFQMAHKELTMRKDIQEDAGFAATFPAYCQVGNQELKVHYAAGDAQAKEFVFQCAKKAMLQHGAKFTDLWQ